MSAARGDRSVSLVLSTYEKPRELRLALQAVAALDCSGLDSFQLVVADDGSGPATAEAVREFHACADFDVRHVWHEDGGFRLAKIRNRALRECVGDVIVFVDGDSLVEPGLLLAHVERCAPGRAVSGWRSQLDESESDALLESNTTDASALASVIESATSRDRWRRRVVFAKNGIYRAMHLKERPKFIGGNCSVRRADLERVNGFDERFEGWGLEDDDLARRLRRAGVHVEDGTLDCAVVHLFHLTHPSHRPTMHHTRNFEYFHRPGFLTRCRHGLESRPLRDVAFAIEGEPPPALRELRRHLGSAAEGAAEVRLVFDSTGAARREQYVLPVPAFESLEDALAFLETAI